MKKILLAFVLLPALTLASGGGGLPSRPSFQSAQIQGTGFNCAGHGTTPDPTCEPLIIRGTGTFNDTGTAPHGMLNIYNPSLTADMIIIGPPTAKSSVRFANTNGLRWSISKNSTAESGGNVGSDFIFDSFDDTGQHLFAPLTIERATGQIDIIGTLKSTKACATNFARLNPNECAATLISNTTMASGACAAVAAPTSDTTSLLLNFRVIAKSHNAVGLDSALIDAYSDNICTLALKPTPRMAYADGYEFTALGATTELGISVEQKKIILPSAGATVYLQLTGTANAFGEFGIVGYGD